MRMRPFCAMVCLFLALAACAAAATPGATRLATALDGGVYGGYQVSEGDDGEFALFTLGRRDAAAKGLGGFNGRLAGVAVRPSDGALLALTGDGALGAYGDETESLVLPDARWRMLDLAFHRGGPVALHHDQADNGLYLAVPDGKGSWTRREPALAFDAGVAKAVLVAMEDDLHVLWISRARDFSRGAIRHLAVGEGGSRELEPLPLGDVRTFDACVDMDVLTLAAVVPDPLGARPPVFVARVWRDGEWHACSALAPGKLPDYLLAAGDFSGGGAGSRKFWLIADALGVAVLPAEYEGRCDGLGEAEGVLEAAVRLRARPPESPAAEWASLAMFAGFLALLALYCRRSRQLSRTYPGRPPDLISRGVALTVDWLLVSLGMTTYYIASGDIRIVDELMNLEAMNRLFWINLGAFALYTALCEGVYGRTPGKYLTGMRVRSLAGGPPSALQALSRSLARGIDMFPLPIGIPGLLGLVVALWNPRRLRIGDLLASTVVRRHLPYRERSFVLASASPRRRELLEALGLKIRVEPQDVDESAIAGADAQDTARLLAEAKASAARDNSARQGEIVIAADTVVVLDGDILGKPADAAEAARMLSRLSGRSHSVVTGVAVWDPATGQAMSDIEVTEVEFRDLSEREIADYVATGDPMDKAGAYGVQSANLVRQIRGSLSNVAGLPMEKLQWMLSLLDS